MNKLKLTLFLLVFFFILGGIGIGNYFLNKVADNPQGTMGNTAGNLQNGGLFCEDEGIVYFVNPYDDHTLYSMNPDETDIKQISSMGVKWINAAGKYLYFYQNSSSEGSGLGYVIETTGMYRMSKNGRQTTQLKRGAFSDVMLIDNQIIYRDLSNSSVTVNAIGTDKENDTVLLEHNSYPGSVDNSTIYYANYHDNLYLYALDPATGMNTMIWNHRVWNPIYHTDGYIYYMDIETDYQLHRYHPVTQSVEVLTTDRIDMFNVYGDYIYYQVSSETSPALMRMYTYGGGQEIVANGVYHNIHITSNNVYFNSFNSDIPIYRQSLYGPVNVTTFQPVAE